MSAKLAARVVELRHQGMTFARIGRTLELVPPYYSNGSASKRAVALYRTAKPEANPRISIRTCNEPNCTRPHLARGKCRKHYDQNYRRQA